MASNLHFLIQSNVPQQVSYYKSNFGPLKAVVRLNGYPHAVQTEILTAVVDMAAAENTPAQIIHHCMDNSLQGVILPEIQAGVYGSDIYAPDEFSYLASFDPEMVQTIQKDLKTAGETMVQARKIHDAQEKIYINNMDFAKADRLADQMCEKLLKGRGKRNPACAVHRFFGAATVQGNINYIPQLTQDLAKRYFIKGRPGTGKSTYLKKIAKTVLAHGYDVEIYHCSFDPNSLDMIVVRELDVCLFDSTAPHEYFPTLPADEVVDLYALCVTPGTDETYSDELSNLEKKYKEMVQLGMESVHNAKQTVDAFDHALPKLDATQIKVIQNSIIKQIF